MAFATVGQLATRLGRTFTSSETGQAAAVLDDATAYLQSVIGQKVEAGSMTVELSVEPTAQKVRLPQWLHCQAGSCRKARPLCRTPAQNR